eukprot:CAMPEP_0116130080 /NCGR_PEP_ID=MMETSP0329-20121206/8265_1 /TAXON_ID=697910 /ORGANISM="Pseudo-nitzschia arenysensis, Strain B593" /LENGTH=878 /DNA_ID=CAMNT_0003624387 /DNA_START=300 /DNA_END=2936 /DNA_ORIENTATION=+
MTNSDYYHHQKQEDATRATSSFIETKAKNPDVKLTSSPLRSTAPNSASSSPISFGNSNVGNNNNPSTMMQTTNQEPPMDVSTMLEQQNAHPELEHRHYVSSPQNNNGYSVSRGPLSPQSAPPTTSGGGVSLGTTPIPSVIHTESGVDSGSNMARARTHSSTPHFPSINTGNTSATPNLVAKRSTNKVTGKKKHQISKSKSGGNVALTQSTSNPRLNEGGGTKSNGQKKQRRLERNRLSAQLSRRRRKQYLEELEDRVVHLSLDMDSGRRKHAFQAIDRISEMRQQVLSSAEAVVREMESSDGSQTLMLNFQMENYMRLLENAGPLARTNSEELLILNSFLGQQLKSFSLPSHAKFILWLSLQGDTYYRGGRAASERLSAARIGERMLVSGNDKVTPTNAMWPLVCNEVGLSYELEERLRVYQRTTILQEKSSWLVRHTARSSALVMQSFHDCVGSMAQVVGNRENATTKDVLTPLQRVKYLAWVRNNSGRIKARLQARRERALQKRMGEEKNDANAIDIGSYVDSEYQLNKSHHLAANLYILNHQLSRIVQDYPYEAPPTLTPPVLKKLMRRASFESLGQQKEPDSKSMTREDSSNHSMKSHPSNGSLFQSASSHSLANDSERPAQITPQVGEQAAAELVEQALGFVKPIIPPIPKPVNPVLTTVYAPAPVTHSAPGTVPTQDGNSMAIEYHSHQFVPAPVTSYGAPAQLAPAPPSNHHVAQPPQYETVPMHHLPNHPAQIHSYNYSTAPGQPATQAYHQPQTEHYYPPQQHVHYTPAIAAPAPGQQLPPASHEQIAPVYETSSSVIQHQPQAQPGTKSRHVRKSSFLPASLNNLNVVPEDMFPGVEGTAADFIELQDCLMDGEDWGIGIGLDMDTTS